MKRFKSLCSFLGGMFIGSASSFFTLAVLWRNAIFVILGIIMASIYCFIAYSMVKTNKEEDKNNKKED